MEYQINSFIHKFNELWNKGQQTRLSIESKEGRASMHLKLDLGLSRAHIFNRNNPARQRRRERRAENRANSTAENIETGITSPVESTAVNIDTTKKTDIPVTNITEKVINTTKALPLTLLRQQ